MKDNEIIKALECCTNHNALDNCDTCPLCDYGNCQDTLIKYCSNTINRQKAEIEQLKFENLALSQKRITMFERIDVVNNARNKAIREFAKKLKKKSSSTKIYGAGVYYKKKYILPEAVDNLVKEMTEGEDNG